MIRNILLMLACLSTILIAGDNGMGHAPHLDGSSENLGIIWIVPFVGILLSIAIFPLVAPDIWHHHFGKISLFWGVSFILPFLMKEGVSITLYEILHVSLLEYIPFIILLLALFTISGGVRLTGSLVGTPVVNTLIILIGTVLASWMGTTGAAMLLIRPLIRANALRENKTHIIVFFIFSRKYWRVTYAVGRSTFVFRLFEGGRFFWTTKSMIIPMLFMVISLLIIFYSYDSFLYNKENIIYEKTSDEKPLGLEGSFNLYLLLGVIAAVLLSGFWKPNVSFNIYYVDVELQNITRDIILLSLTYVSWTMTSMEIRNKNEFTWFPIEEVAKLFAGIFITIIPAIAILKAGTKGALAPVVASVTSEAGPVNIMYFWLTGILSSFLDNAPTYLVFFNTAGGDATILMTEKYNTLLAISMGAVFMGANTYIGNAPNFMVKSISESSGVEMPSFFGYFFKWSIPILMPLFIIVTYLFF